jgi:hypothetical protein
MAMLGTGTGRGKCRAHAGTRAAGGRADAGRKGVGFRRLEEKNGRESG